MASAAAVRRRKPKPAPAKARGWWGEGPPPHERWPGVTIEIPAVWSKARSRWESPDGRFYFDQAAADKACKFFPAFLRHHKGEFADRPFDLLDYQSELIIRPLFGWKRKGDGLRRFRKLFAMIPKGNGKSPLAAGIGLYLLLCDGEEGAEVFSAAADREQAGIVFDTAKVMVETSPYLTERCQVFRRVIEAPGNSTYKVLSADVATKHGFNVHGLVFDEFHAQASRDLYEALSRGMVKRTQPVLVMITTAGDDDLSICAEEYDFAIRVKSGSIPADEYLPVIFEASPKDDWTDPRVWAKCNPGLGLLVKRDAIEAECRAALAEPRKRNDFLRYHLNRWTSQAVAWIPVEWWDGCEGALSSDAELGKLACAAGLDMAQKIDLAAFVVSFREPLASPVEAEVTGDDEGRATKRTVSLNYRVTVLPFFWIPESTLREREAADGVPYSLWASAGLVHPTEGDVIDYDVIFKDITTKIVPRFPRLKGAEIGYDPAFATELALKLQGAGLRMVEVLQNYKHLSEPSQVFEALVKAGRLLHDGNRVLRNHVENVAIRQDDAGRIRPVKPRRAGKRIDGVVGAIMGISRLISQPSTPLSGMNARAARGEPVFRSW